MREAAMEQIEDKPSSGRESLWDELRRHWDRMPSKGAFFALFAAWLALFHFWGNATLGYVDTKSLFVWLDWMYSNGANDEHGVLIPFLVVVLFIWKRDELAAVPKRGWWPALAILFLGILLHFAGFLGQQTQLSAVGFFFGLYGLTGLVWGPRWLIASFFPFCLFAFAIPVGNVLMPLSFPLRLIATQLTGMVCQTILGIDIIVEGTQIMEPGRAYMYEVAAACAGIRSLVAMVALATVYAYIGFKSPWRRLVILPLSIPLAVAANVVRLTTIVVAAETFGQAAGNYVHESGLFSLLPYVPGIVGLFVIGYFLREDRRKENAPDVKATMRTVAKEA